MEELGVVAQIGPLVYTQGIIRESSTMFDFWYWIENPDDFINIDLSTVSHGFEHDEVGFYDPRDLDLPLRPERLPELVDIWVEKGAIFVQALS
jgi:hypothetical protein